MNELQTAFERSGVLHAMGFENEHEYRLYLQIKRSLQQPIQIGVAG